MCETRPFSASMHVTMACKPAFHCSLSRLPACSYEIPSVDDRAVHIIIDELGLFRLRNYDCAGKRCGAGSLCVFFFVFVSMFLFNSFFRSLTLTKCIEVYSIFPIKNAPRGLCRMCVRAREHVYRIICCNSICKMYFVLFPLNHLIEQTPRQTICAQKSINKMAKLVNLLLHLTDNDEFIAVEHLSLAPQSHCNGPRSQHAKHSHTLAAIFRSPLPTTFSTSD